MIDYRIIQNANGYIPQRRSFTGWESLSETGFWIGKVIAYLTLDEARAAIDFEEQQRLAATDWNTGKIVEYYDSTK